MKITYAPYELKPKFSFGPKTGKTARRGALLRFDFPGIGPGHADCHPWETLGDLSLEKQLSLLKNGETTPLTKRSLYFAKLDATARAKKKSLFENIVVPKSHFLITDYLKTSLPDDWEIVKIKCRDQLPKIAEKLNRETRKWGGKIRFDGNNLFTQNEIANFLEKLSSKVRAAIDFFEDPFPFRSEVWQNLQKRFEVPFAKDHQAVPGEAGYDIVILKPDIQDLKPFQKSAKRKIVTGYLGHPFGQLCAAYEASLCTREVCGLLSHLAFDPNPYSQQLALRGARLIPPAGTGFGFDNLLKKEDWILL